MDRPPPPPEEPPTPPASAPPEHHHPQPPQGPASSPPPGGSPPPLYAAPPPLYAAPPPLYAAPPPRRKRTGLLVALTVAVAFIFVVVLLIVEPWGSKSGEPPTADDSPEEVAEKYMDTMVDQLGPGRTGGIEELVAAVEQYACSFNRSDVSDELYGEYDSIFESGLVLEDYTITAVEESGDTASVTVEVEGFYDSGDGASFEESFTIDMWQEQGIWLICSPPDEGS